MLRNARGSCRWLIASRDLNSSFVIATGKHGKLLSRNLHTSVSLGKSVDPVVKLFRSRNRRPKQEKERDVLKTPSGEVVYSSIREGCQTPVPLHPGKRFFDHSKYCPYPPLVPDAVERALTDYQYSVGTGGSTRVARIDQNSIASNIPTEDRHNEHHYRIQLNAAEAEPQDVLFFGVYDGHGGEQCADMVRTELPKYAAQELAKRRSLAPKKIKEALTEAFLRLEKDIDEVGSDPQYAACPKAVNAALAGACAILCCVVKDRIYVANAGDVRAVLGRRGKDGTLEPIPLSKDHTGSNEEERARIEGEHPAEEKEMLLLNDRLLGWLEPTRAFGNLELKRTKEQMSAIFERMREGLADAFDYDGYLESQMVKTPPYVTARPEITVHKLTAADRFLVLATDGLWVKLDSEGVIRCMDEYYQKHISSGPGSDPTSVEGNAATSLIHQALISSVPAKDREKQLERFLSHSPSRWSRDDITVTVLFFDTAARDCEGLQTKRTLPVITEVDPTTWEDTVKKEIQKNAAA